MSANRKNVTISIDPRIHMEFKIECVRNSNEMSIVIENFMKNYISASKKLHMDKNLKNLEYERGQ